MIIIVYHLMFDSSYDIIIMDNNHDPKNNDGQALGVHLDVQ